MDIARNNVPYTRKSQCIEQHHRAHGEDIELEVELEGLRCAQLAGSQDLEEGGQWLCGDASASHVLRPWRALAGHDCTAGARDVLRADLGDDRGFDRRYNGRKSD